MQTNYLHRHALAHSWHSASATCSALMPRVSDGRRECEDGRHKRASLHLCRSVNPSLLSPITSLHLSPTPPSKLLSYFVRQSLNLSRYWFFFVLFPRGFILVSFFPRLVFYFERRILALCNKHSYCNLQTFYIPLEIFQISLLCDHILYPILLGF